MIKKTNSTSVKLIKYYKLINHNLIYNNKAINRYKKDNFEISADKAENLERLKKSIGAITVSYTHLTLPTKRIV